MDNKKPGKKYTSPDYLQYSLMSYPHYSTPALWN